MITFMIYVLLPSPIYKWGNWGFENLRKFPKFPWLVNGTVGTQIHAVSFQMLHSWSHLGLGDKTRWQTEPGLPTAFQVAVLFRSPACSLAFPPSLLPGLSVLSFLLGCLNKLGPAKEIFWASHEQCVYNQSVMVWRELAMATCKMTGKYLFHIFKDNERKIRISRSQ